MKFNFTRLFVMLPDLYKKYIKKALFTYLLILASYGASAQDTDSITFHLSNEAHAFFNDNITNPAYTGIFTGHHLHLFGGTNSPFYNYGEFNVPYKAGASYDFTFGKSVNQSLGLFYQRSQEGVLSGYMAGLSYAHTFDIYATKDFYHKIRAGAALFYQREHFDLKRLTFGENIDPKYGFIWNGADYYKWLKDTLSNVVGFSTGFWYHNPYGYLGVAANGTGSYDTTQKKIQTATGFVNIAAGGHVYLSNVYTLHPAINIEWGMGALKTLSSWSPSLTFSRNDKLYLGFQYRDMNKLTVIAGLNFGRVVSLSLMYGVNPADGFAWYDVAYLGGQLRFKIRKEDSL